MDEDGCIPGCCEVLPDGRQRYYVTEADGSERVITIDLSQMRPLTPEERAEIQALLWDATEDDPEMRAVLERAAADERS